MKIDRWMKITGMLLLALSLLRPTNSFAFSGPPPLTDVQIGAWNFDDEDWLKMVGDSPISFTNIDNPADWDGHALQVDSPYPAWLQYNIVEEDSTTNLAFSQGTIEFWFNPDWNSGHGPGDSGRLIEVGAYGTNNPSSWWSLYFNPGGTNLYFSSETNGVFTNYLSVPIAWASNNWHLIDLVYSSLQSQLFIDGQLVANGAGSLYQPSPAAFTNGFFVGSDVTGTQQMRGQMDNLATFNYAVGADMVAYDYEQATNGDSGSGTDSGGGRAKPDYGTNLFVIFTSVVSNTIPLVISNTPSDVLLEIQGCTNLAQGVWFSEGFVDGSELTNWTAANIPVHQPGNLFLRIRSWQDTTGTGMPDWWWIANFGETTNVDAYAEDPADDGLTDLQKYQMGLDPTNYYNPNPPPGFFGTTVGTNVFIEWNPAPGPVLNYAIQRGIQQINGSYVYTQIGLTSSNAAYFEDTGAISNANAWNNIYTLTADYPGSVSSGTDTWSAIYAEYGFTGLPYGPPPPTNVYACADATGTNLLLSWTPPAAAATNYWIERGVYDTNTYEYDYSLIAHAGSNATSLEIVGELTNAPVWNVIYGVAAVFPGGIVSPIITSPINVGSNAGTAGPTGLYGYADSTSTNVYLGWNPSTNATGYLVYGNYSDPISGQNIYAPLGTVGAGATGFEVVGAFDASTNSLYDSYTVVAIYAGGVLSQPAATWLTATPAVNALNAYLDFTGTNVELAWTPAKGATGYLIQKSDYYGADGSFYQIAEVSSNKLSLADTNGVASGYAGADSIIYQVQAMFPHGGLSAAVTTNISNLPPAPGGLTATVTGTNVQLTWTPALGAVSNYIILRGVYDPTNSTYSYTPISMVSGSTTTYEDVGAISSGNSYYNAYEIEAVYTGNNDSSFDSSYLPGPPPLAPASVNLDLTANLVRNGTGRWQIMFPSLSTNVQNILLAWSLDHVTNEQIIATSEVSNGIYPIPDWQVVSLLGDTLTAQPWDANGNPGRMTPAGTIPNDAPYFVDGRQHLKQNLEFVIRAAALNKPFGGTYVDYDDWNQFAGSGYSYRLNQSATNFEEFSFLYHGSVTVLDNLWPFAANYYLANNLVDVSRTNATQYPIGNTNFTFIPNFATNIPAPPILGDADPYWIIQPGFDDGGGGDYDGETNWGLTVSETNTVLSLQSGLNNMFGLPYQTGCEADLDGEIDAFDGGIPFFLAIYQPLPAGGSVTIEITDDYYHIGSYASGCPAPTLTLSDYYFAPLLNPTGNPMNLPDVSQQPIPTPLDDTFKDTNQTPPVMVASVGQPMIVGGWAKYSVEGSANKYAYLGQYFETNALLLNGSGDATTTNAGILSPYGEFFPTQAGQAQVVTMPDIDPPYGQGTGVVDVISLNVDANHDGTMDFTYQGPDFVSASNPYRFWVNDDQDSGDDGGNFGIPGQIPPVADGWNYLNAAGYHAYNGLNTDGFPIYSVHGRRDLVDFFPIYLNIGSLFQSNALSAGISVTDTNYQFILSQADGILRFVYTDLTPTNYMNYLQDTNESGLLANALATPIPPAGVALTNTFLNSIGTNNEGIILVEAASATTQPLVLTIYHGTNQIAQTSLSLSISGVEQMFRSKTMLLHSTEGTVADRLTDADVPNEPDTINKNFVFLHGYNVLPDEARGVAADVFKRMYWSGSHAKFWAVTWQGADSKDTIPGNLLTPNYHTNVVNAFATAPLLANFIATLTNSGPVTLAAHSLANMVALSAISDWDAPISQYFMLDAAVPIEAVDPSAVTNMMVLSTWLNYSNRLFASQWYQLFPTNDARSTLSWNNRLGNLRNVDVYNFYSSGEEVLRTYIGDPPTNVLGIVGTQIINNVWSGVPFGTGTWYWQEKGKGPGSQDWFLCSSHGGWKFSTYWVDSYGNPLSPSIMNDTSNALLQTQPMFDFSSTINPNLSDLDNELLSSDEVDASAYAATNRDRILADAIPAMSQVIGANPIPIFQASGKNIDMMTLENGWSQSRTGSEAGKWHHSDFQQMAYTFTYKLYAGFVATGNLK